MLVLLIHATTYPSGFCWCTLTDESKLKKKQCGTHCHNEESNFTQGPNERMNLHERINLHERMNLHERAHPCDAWLTALV